MPFEALDAETEALTLIKDASPERTYICPVCRRELSIRRAFIRRGFPVHAHFFHRLGTPDHPWPYAESPAHLAAKQALIRWLKRDFFWRDAAFLHTETPIHTRRRTDVMVTLPDGSRIAHEIQLSPITPAEFRRRTRDYLAAGIPVFWWFDVLRINYAFRRTPVRLLQPTHLALQFEYDDGFAANRHTDFPRRVSFAIAFDTFSRRPDTFNLDPSNPLPLEAARLLWRAMLWAPLWRLGDTAAPCPAAVLYAALPAFWRARFSLGDLTAFLHHCRTLGLAEQTSGGWRFLSPTEPGFLSPLFTATTVTAPAPAEKPDVPDVPDMPLDPVSIYHCPYQRETPLRSLWDMARDVLAAADDWLSAAGILDRFSDADRFDAEQIAAQKQTPLPELLRLALTVRWEAGDVVAGAGCTWRLQYLPGFNPTDWQAKLAQHFSPAADNADPWHAFSVRYHRWFWRKRNAPPEDIRRMEFLPDVLAEIDEGG